MADDLPTVMTTAGLQPQSPASLRAQLVAAVLATNPDFTDNLPGSMIEDIVSTIVAAIALCDSARVETVNSLTPFGANAFILNQLGQVLGIPLGLPTNTSVDVIFTGTVGFVVPKGFTVSDGTYQYIAQDGAVIGSGGSSAQVFCLATQSGTWPVPSGTVSQLVTSVPIGITLSVTNPQAGIPSSSAESETSYRSRVLQAIHAPGQGMPTYLKTLLQNVPGVQPRLVSVIQAPNNSGWEIIVGGGDIYQIAYAIYRSLFGITTLVGSTLAVTGITNANPGVMTTSLNHGFSSGQVIHVTGVVGTSGINGVPLTITVLTEKTFSIGINTTSSGAYVSGGVITPNFRNMAPAISDYPDVYTIPFVIPPQQSVAMTVTWNTTASGFVLSSSVAQLGAPALADYINNLAVGVPINLFELQTVFQAAIASVLPPQLLTRMLFSVTINGIVTAPDAGTGIIEGDPESYFLTTSTQITITQG